MKCPLFIMSDTRVQLGEETEVGDCIKEDCAWYDLATGCCSVLSISRLLTAVGNVLGNIHADMPSRSQFRDR